MTVRYQLARPHRLSLETAAARAGLHPDLVRRFVALGLLDASRDVQGRLWFDENAPAALARIQRLRCGLSLNYAAIGVVLDLLERISRLETALQAAGRSGTGGNPPWT
ncbi:chaperone modulator CbpM [Saccharopolyspora phatthalungensis]|uniref:DNA-binding transcriptional MerR regulator n=1 Tax=Saccharopolyspora phatthalungensis TaxID=664693 RepID=A0A840QEY9_9PSEU|nr:chaperone modulator CbpM [Saccharopolyspora phatthalungensis]MBB5158607.1 DNA-binding transcriptional MerR regulator [Saccharopolyspora phatthalungensis]